MLLILKAKSETNLEHNTATGALIWILAAESKPFSNVTLVKWNTFLMKLFLNFASLNWV